MFGEWVILCQNGGDIEISPTLTGVFEWHPGEFYGLRYKALSVFTFTAILIKTFSRREGTMSN